MPYPLGSGLTAFHDISSSIQEPTRKHISSLPPRFTWGNSLTFKDTQWAAEKGGRRDGHREEVAAAITMHRADRELLLRAHHARVRHVL